MLLVFICISIIAGVIIFGILTYNDHKKERQDYFAELRAATDRLAAARRNFELLDKPIQGLIRKQFGGRMAENVATETISTGMPVELLLTSWGEPELRQPLDEENALQEKWCYDAFTDQQAVTKYKTEIVIANERVASWKDFDQA